ncbi:MAG: carbamoyltransferase C-terminal domain-containing protein [Patescibacteria group bacterium]|jgi:carbamoyltransferase
MLILGLNGCHKRSHDAAACLVKDDKILAIAEEERFTRQKRAFDSYPINSSKFCLNYAKINFNDLDAIAIGFADSKINETVYDEKILNELFPERFFGSKKKLPIYYVKHHLAHAASVYFTSQMDETAILIVDGQGETEATSIFQAKGNQIKLIKKYDFNHSLGFLYSAISIFCGLGGFGAGKLMGLAAYGEPIYKKEIEELFDSVKLESKISGDYQDEFAEVIMSGLKNKGFKKAIKITKLDLIRGKIDRFPEIEKTHKDLAASTQAFLEDKLIELTKEAKQLTGCNNLCISGGVALNCVANSVIENSEIFKNIFIQPACEDSGSAIGAALMVNSQKITDKLNPYMGNEFSDLNIESTLSELKLNYEKINNIEQKTAELVSKGNIVGWFQGRMEFGPRALGNRSIVADPRMIENHKKVNLAKGRELWRPFGPSVLAEKGEEIFENFVMSPFMLKSFTVKKDWQKQISAVTHVDGTTRPQTVTREENSKYYQMISEFEKITGIPAVLNTSFNYAGEPLVSTPIDAIRTFYSSGLDYLVLENYLIKK